MAVGKAARAVARGQGPAKQAATFNLTAIAAFMTAVPDPMAPIILGGPCWPCALMAIGAFFLLRELELAAAKIMDLTVCVSSRRVDWFLPVSNMDARGHGRARSWTCICVPGELKVCAFCLLLAIHDRAEKEGGPAFREQLIFPTVTGDMVPKDLMILSFREAVAVSQSTGYKREPIEAISGHSLRRTGAQFLAHLGLELALIQLLGRWGSNDILRYIAEAPLAHLARRPTSCARSPRCKPSACWPPTW